jgi:hypothetical protein
MTTIERLRELLEKATPGPWESTDKDGLYANIREPTIEAESGRVADMYDLCDAALIVAMRNTLPALLEVAEAAKAYSESGGFDEKLWLDGALAKLDQVTP